MINEDYDISIIGIQSVDGESDEVILNTVGSYTKEGNSRYITYTEYDPETPSNSNLSTLKVDDDKVTLMSGEKETHLILEKGIRHKCCYDTGFGTLSMGVFTSVFSNCLDDSGGNLNVKYTLDIESSLSSCNEITVKVHRRNLGTLPQE